MRENLWTFDAVAVGQRGRDTEVTLTPADIAEFALVSQNDDPRYRDGAVAMPTMILSYAPLMRESIANANGFVALEQSQTARRQTPFTKCEVVWFAPVRAGDTLTAERWVHDTYERRGSNFVTFRVQASNQHGTVVGRYDYTCIFDYARGQRNDPRATESVERSEIPSSHAGTAWADFDSIVPGDALAGIAVSETQASMNAKDAFRLIGPRGIGNNIHTDEAFARDSIFGSTVNSGPATMAYVDQMLERTFPAEALYFGGRLLMRAITPFRDRDTVVFSGEAIAKRVDDDAVAWVDCTVAGTSQAGALVCAAEATLRWIDR